MALANLLEHPQIKPDKIAGTGDQTLMKKLDRGAFLLPAPEHDGKPFVIMKPSMLPRLFR